MLWYSSTAYFVTHPIIHLTASQLPKISISTCFSELGMLRRGGQNHTHWTPHISEALEPSQRNRGRLHVSRLSEMEDRQLDPLVLQVEKQGHGEVSQPGHCGVNNGRSSDLRLFSSQKSVDSVPRKRAHTSSVNRKGLSGLFHHSKRRVVARECGQKTLDNHQWSCPALNSLGPGAEEGSVRAEGKGKMFRKVREGGVNGWNARLMQWNRESIWRSSLRRKIYSPHAGCGAS